MRVQVFAICYNEEVLLPYFLRHYSKFCEKITIYDNHSTDRSLEICKANPLVEVISYDSGNQIRDDIYLQIKNNCWKGCKADWVIVCDIDEFVVGMDNIDDYTIVSPNWWEMVSDKVPIGEGQIYDEIYYGRPQGQTTKCVIFRPDLQEINYTPGAHSINPVGETRILATSNINILHYKFISLQYVIDRYAEYCKRLSDINKQSGWGTHYTTDIGKITTTYNELQSQKIKVL
jgi:hypothetical protein